MLKKFVLLYRLEYAKNYEGSEKKKIEFFQVPEMAKKAISKPNGHADSVGVKEENLMSS